MLSLENDVGQEREEKQKLERERQRIEADFARFQTQQSHPPQRSPLPDQQLHPD